MSKKENITDALGDLLGNTPVPAVKKEIVVESEIPEKYTDNYKVVSIRMSESDKENLTAHFKRKGIINFSTGIRMIINDYMEKEHIV